MFTAQLGERRGRGAENHVTAAATRGVYDKWAAAIGADLVTAAEAAVKGINR